MNRPSPSEGGKGVKPGDGARDLFNLCRNMTMAVGNKIMDGLFEVGRELGKEIMKELD